MLKWNEELGLKQNKRNCFAPLDYNGRWCVRKRVLQVASQVHSKQKQKQKQEQGTSQTKDFSPNKGKYK